MRARTPSRPASRAVASSPRSGWPLVAIPALTAALVEVRDDARASPACCSSISCWSSASPPLGGFVPAFVAAIAAFLLANYYFTPPIHTFTIAVRDNLIALVRLRRDRGGRRHAGQPRWRGERLRPLRAQSHAETLAQLGATLMSEQDPLPGLMAGLRTAFGCVSAAVLRDTGDGWVVESCAGEPVPSRPDGC